MTAAERARRTRERCRIVHAYVIGRSPVVCETCFREALLAHEAEVRAEYVCKCEKHGKGVSLPMPCPFCMEAEVREECAKIAENRYGRGHLALSASWSDQCWKAGQLIAAAIRDSGREKERKE